MLEFAYIWGRKEDLTKKHQVVEQHPVNPSPPLTLAPRWEEEKQSRRGVEMQDY